MIVFLWTIIEELCKAMHSHFTAHCVMDCTYSKHAIARWVFLNYILWPKGYSQNPQHNFPRFLELFLNFYYLTATYTADRSIVLVQKQIFLPFKCIAIDLYCYFFSVYLLGLPQCPNINFNKHQHDQIIYTPLNH